MIFTSNDRTQTCDTERHTRTMNLQKPIINIQDAILFHEFPEEPDNAGHTFPIP